MIFYNRLKEHRMAAEMSSKQAAAETGFNVTTVFRHESGGWKLPHHVLIKYSEVYGVRPKDILLPPGLLPQ